MTGKVLVLNAVLAVLAMQVSQAAGTLTLSADGLTVFDSANGITWLADANLAASTRFGLPLCTASSGKPCVNESGVMDYQSATAWIAAMNTANYLGHNNWQLPTTPSIDKTCGKVGPNGDSFGFGCTAGALDSVYNTLGLKSPATAVPIPNNIVGPFSNIQPYLYWSQSAGGSNQGNLTFSFATGWQGANTLPNFLYLWPMLPGRLPSIPTPAGDGLQVSADEQTVYDPLTNITWLANANLAATNTFGLPRCTDPLTPPICIASDGAMTWDSAVQFIAGMNSSAYLGVKNWQAPTIDTSCPGYGCGGIKNPMGNLFYTQFGLAAGNSAVTVPNIAVGPFHNLEPYLYWTCGGATIQSSCEADGPVPNQEWSYSFGSGFQGTDILPNSLYVTAYFVGARVATSGPVISLVANAEGESLMIAPNTWIEIKGASLAPAGDSRIWQSSDFTDGKMPTQLDGVSATVNGKAAYVYYISPGQVNILTPPDAMSGAVQVVLNNNSSSATFTAQADALSPSFFILSDNQHVAAVHLDGTLVGPSSFSVPGYTFSPAKPGETISIYGNGFGPTSTTIVSGSITQSGSLSPVPVVKIGGTAATIQFAGLVSPGLFQFNTVVPMGLSDGDQPITATFGGTSTQAGTLIAIQH
jgi:uncharacterized protein (TIGR03437 family)